MTFLIGFCSLLRLCSSNGKREMAKVLLYVYMNTYELNNTTTARTNECEEKKRTAKEGKSMNLMYEWQQRIKRVRACFFTENTWHEWRVCVCAIPYVMCYLQNSFHIFPFPFPFPMIIIVYITSIQFPFTWIMLYQFFKKRVNSLIGWSTHSNVCTNNKLKAHHCWASLTVNFEANEQSFWIQLSVYFTVCSLACYTEQSIRIGWVEGEVLHFFMPQAELYRVIPILYVDISHHSHC